MKPLASTAAVLALGAAITFGPPAFDTAVSAAWAQGDEDCEGGKPVWADSFIDTVDLSRLNMARSPDNVLNRAFNEALYIVIPAMVALYNLSTAEMIYETSTTLPA